MAAKKKAKKSKTAVKKKAAKKKVANKARPAAKKKTKAGKAPARKTPARPPVKAKKKAPVRKKKQIVGEGDYEASRSFLKDQSGFVKENKARIPGLGKDARAALEGSEGPSLLAAEAEARSHSKNQTPEE